MSNTPLPVPTPRNRTTDTPEPAPSTASAKLLKLSDKTCPAGLVGVAVALVVRLAAIRALGRFWSLHLEIRPDHALVTEGIYARLRHPAYAAIMLEVVAIPCVANAYGMLGVGLLVYIPLLLVRWRNEERSMVEKFGDRYVQYQRTVSAFFPRWK